MAVKFEQTGTVAVTSGSLTVTGTGTAWLVDYPGVALNIDGLSYPVSAITSQTTLTLAKPYPGDTASGLAYTFLPLQPENYGLARDVDYLLKNGGVQIGKSAYDLAVENGYVGTEAEWLTSLNGTDGADAEVQVQSIVDLTQFSGQVAGGKGVYLMVPVGVGDPGVALTQQAEVVIPNGSTNAGVGIWARTTSSGYAIVIGLANVPVPQPENPGEDIDLSGSATYYAPFSAITPLGLDVLGAPTSITLSRAFTDAQLKIRRKADTSIIVPSSAQWVTGSSGSPYAVTGDAVSSSMTLEKRGSGTSGYSNGRLILNRGTYLKSPDLGLEFASSSDVATTQTPPSIRLIFRGIVPGGTGKGVQIGTLESWSPQGKAMHQIHWEQNMMEFLYTREGAFGGSVLSDPITNLTGALHTFETEWVNNENGTGGIVTFYVDGEQYGAPKTTEWKPRVPPSANLQVNSSVENTANSVDGLEIEYVGVSVGKPGATTTYSTIADGAITLDDLRNLVVDATGVTEQQTERVLSYTVNGTSRFDLAIVVGEMVLPAGRPFKAVLEDWSTGSAVPHPNELVMTHPAAQNCRFEDAVLYGAQGAWTEVLPQGEVPIIDGIRYGCEGIRQGTYTQFQFVYSLDRASEPFGDPTGLETYMRPHKWMIYDSEGTLLQRIEKPNGEPLNANSTKPIWEGSYDGRAVAMITDNNKWYPHGTVRSSIIYRNGNPPAYSQEFVHANVPVFDQRVPFASHTGFSVNGFDLRIFGGSAGNDGQSNGFANWKLMPWAWGSYSYESIKAWAAATQDPYKNLYADIAATPNAALWLEYTPFNTMGRSSIVGPGGTRDDRQIMPETVARYARDVTTARPHDGKPLADIALDYMTGYASDPFHSVVGGKLMPLYRGNARRGVRMRNHYYGAGETTTSADQAYYVQIGRLSDWTAGLNPLRAKVPYAGAAAAKPYFNGFGIDASHAHQFPGWGSLMWQTPEFAMLQVSFSDQVRLYENSILESMWGPANFSGREAAWKFMHAAIQWKTASTNSTRLYSRAEILDWVVYDFETFYDQWYASTPGFLNPPTNIIENGQISANRAVLAGAARFGPCYYIAGEGLQISEFQSGYWLSALHAAHKLGFLSALRAASPKVEAIVNWLIACHRRRVVGRINEGQLLNAYNNSDYQVRYWSPEEINAASGVVANLPQNHAAVVTAQGANAAPSWDVFTSGGNTYSRDGQAMDQNLAGPALLKDMGLSGTDLDQAVTTAESMFQSKLASETARGSALAGSEWFKYHQTTNNRPYKP